MRPIHNRMPVILDPTSYDLWLNPQMKQRESLETLLRPYPTEEMTAYPVSKAVNKPVNDSAECTERIEAP
jgi:putative SOS response-associated peptidase YedK